MNTPSTAFTRPRTSFGVARATVVERMFIENMSTKPLTARAAKESGNQRESPNTIMLAPKIPTGEQQRSARPAAERLAREHDSGGERADGGRAPQHAQPERAGVQDRAGVEGEQGDRAAEQHGEQVEADRAEDDRRRADEADAEQQALERRAAPWAGRIDAFGLRHRERDHGRGEQQDCADRVHELRAAPRRGGRRSPARRRSPTWPATDRIASAPASSSVGTISGVSDRPAGAPIALAAPVSAASTTYGQS